MGHSLEHIKTQFYRHSEAFELTCGESIQELTLAYETYGELSENKDNAILLFHALTGSQHAAGFNPGVDGVGAMWTEECHVGWWDSFIGPGRCIDTQKFFVICVNYVGGCYGSTGPCSINPLTGERYGGSFPRISAADIVRSQMLVLDLLGIDQLHAVIGPSLGGLLCLTFAGLYPDRVKKTLSVLAVDMTFRFCRSYSLWNRSWRLKAMPISKVAITTIEVADLTGGCVWRA
ncbi:MAG: alpha/beta fold hydrolase [Verrucomicrobia bacterium]|nr:alpha/beta fold hydrolase [Verrucomicrobiota bacterium]